jgi:hypothetical protein
MKTFYIFGHQWAAEVFDPPRWQIWLVTAAVTPIVAVTLLACVVEFVLKNSK